MKFSLILICLLSCSCASRPSINRQYNGRSLEDIAKEALANIDAQRARLNKTDLKINELLGEIESLKQRIDLLEKSK